MVSGAGTDNHSVGDILALQSHLPDILYLTDAEDNLLPDVKCKKINIPFQLHFVDQETIYLRWSIPQGQHLHDP